MFFLICINGAIIIRKGTMTVSRTGRLHLQLFLMVCDFGFEIKLYGSVEYR